MIRVIVVGCAAVVAGGAVAAAGGTVDASHGVLSPPVAAGVSGVTVDDGPDHAAIIHAPPGTLLRAVSSGSVTRDGTTGIDIRGADEDAGLDVAYTGVAGATGATSVQRGDMIGDAPAAPADVTARAVLDGRPLDTADLLRTALSGGGDHSAAGWTRPVEGAVVSQPFGCTALSIEPFDRSCATRHIHAGIDLAVARGTPVHAALDGVAHVVVSVTGYGLHVVLDHGDGLTTLYAHLDSVAIHDGDVVAAGDVIGAVGSSGNSTGPHLHFEVRRDGIAEDPTLDVALP